MQLVVVDSDASDVSRCTLSYRNSEVYTSLRDDWAQQVVECYQRKPLTSGGFGFVLDGNEKTRTDPTNPLTAWTSTYIYIYIIM